MAIPLRPPKKSFTVTEKVGRVLSNPNRKDSHQKAAPQRYENLRKALLQNNIWKNLAYIS